MREHEAADQFVGTFEAERMDRAACFLGCQGHDDAGQQIENERRVDFDHYAILGLGNDVL